MTSLADQTVLVTGANRGLGHETARELVVSVPTRLTGFTSGGEGAPGPHRHTCGAFGRGGGSTVSPRPECQHGEAPERDGCAGAV